jgi:hypothetical protein
MCNYHLGCQTTTEETRLIHVIDKIDKSLDLKPAVVAASQASVSIIHIPGSLTLPVLHNGHIAPTAHLPHSGEPEPSHPLPLLSNHVTTNTVPMVHIQANHMSAQSVAVTSHIHPHLPATARHVGGGSTGNMDADQKPEVMIHIIFMSDVAAVILVCHDFHRGVWAFTSSRATHEKLCFLFVFSHWVAL